MCWPCRTVSAREHRASAGKPPKLFLHWFADFLDGTLHVEVAFRDFIVLAFENLLEAANRVRHGNLLTLTSGENLRNAEWLAQESLNFARSEHRQFVIG